MSERGDLITHEGTDYVRLMTLNVIRDDFVCMAEELWPPRRGSLRSGSANVATGVETLDAIPTAATQLLQRMAASLSDGFWVEQWFVRVRDDPGNAETLRHYTRECENRTLPPWQHCFCFIKFWRNCAVHAGITGLPHYVEQMPAALRSFAENGHIQRLLRELAPPRPASPVV
jgi:hypothetical protein